MPPQPIDVTQAKCTKLSFDSAVKFAIGGEGNKELTGFDINAYTGAVVDRWWGKLVVAVDGITCKQQMPIFLNHDRTKIVGYSTSANNAGVFAVQGVFSKVTEAAAEVKGLAQEGFPWQASIGVEPKTVVSLMESAAMVVNGQEVRGPAEVWLESEVGETSFVPLGADGATAVTVFSEQEQRADTPTTKPIPLKEQTMDLAALKKEHPGLVVALSAEIVAGLTVEALRKDRPEMVTEIVAEGAKLERDRVADVRAQLIPGHEGLVAQLELDGKSSGADAAKAIVAAEKLARQQMGQSLDIQANPAVPVQGDPAAGQKTITRAEFNKLSDQQRRAELSAGTQII